MDRKPLIFDVRRGSTEDGPGIRTTVFFKGCNLRCAWCHNPESIDPEEEIGFSPRGCVACGECERACACGACSLDNPQRIDRALCTRCGACVDACPGEALRRIGRHYPVEELVGTFLRDAPLYRASGGGVTLSGGEPTVHMEYTADLLARLKALGVSTAIETNGLFQWEEFRDMLLPHVDLIMMDVKVADPEKHQEYTGTSNDQILENLRRLALERPGLLLPRVPLIPGFSATEENLVAVGSLLRSFGIERYSLLEYNPTWFHKASAVGMMIDPRLPACAPSREEMAGWSRLIAR